MLESISESELILNADGSVYHLHVKNEHIADTVLLVGDPERVEKISRHFESTEVQISNREFVTHTGYYQGKRITAMSSGIGTDNIDIVINELHAAVNIHPETRLPREQKRHLQLIRIGTSGAIQEDIPTGTQVAAAYGLGLEGMMYFYPLDFMPEEEKMTAAFMSQCRWDTRLARPYFIKSSEQLLKQIGFDMRQGITVSGPGFYAPQGRHFTAEGQRIGIRPLLTAFEYKKLKINNFDMETSALYGLGRYYGFECCTVNVVLANRNSGKFAGSYDDMIGQLILTVLNRL